MTEPTQDTLTRAPRRCETRGHLRGRSYGTARGDGMSQDGVARWEEIVRALVIGAEGNADPGMNVLAAELRTHPKLLLDALKELSDLGSESRPRAPDAVEWARSS
jgi:hypothetical protein